MTTTNQKNLEEIRTEANVILKVVDQFVKAGLLEQAKEHLEKARLIDPTNAYIYAFQERIAFLKEEAAKKNIAVSNRKVMEDAAREKIDADRRRVEAERSMKVNEEDLKKIDGWLQKKAEDEKRQQEELANAASGRPAPESSPAPKMQSPVSPVPEPAPASKILSPVSSPLEPAPKNQTPAAPAHEPLPAPKNQTPAAPAHGPSPVIKNQTPAAPVHEPLPAPKIPCPVTPVQKPVPAPKNPDPVASAPGTVPKNPRPAPPVPSHLQRIAEKFPEQSSVSASLPSSEQSAKQADDAHDMYKRVLLLAWADGAISPEEESQLRDLRTTLRITAAEHTKIELEAKEESYTHAFTLVWTSGMSSKERSAVINELRHKYQISSEIHSRIESKILTEFGQREYKPTLYVIDDDENVLAMIIRILEGGGFAVKAFNTSDEALNELKHDLPDLIVSDINLETSTIGGFSFYENIRQLQHLSHVPFIFLSGMTDEGMVRYGKGLGADDYITKPFSGDMLLDTIKGKLKRYKQMKTQTA